MSRLIVFALAGFVTVGAAASTESASRELSQLHSYHTVMHLSGDEYHDAHNNLVNAPRGTKCSSPPAVSTMGCWTWTAKGVGHGSYTLGQPTLEGSHLVWTFMLTDARGESLTGTLEERFIPDPSPSDRITHANRYPATYTFTAGTGRFGGVAGALASTATTITVDVDPATGVAHSKFGSKAVGTLTFPSKL